MSVGRKIVFVIALMVFVGAVGAIVMHYMQSARESGAFEELREAPKEKGFWTDKGFVIGKYAALYKKNHDLIGWVKIKGTNIDYPVMHTPDKGNGEFYLRKNFKKEYALSGTPFLDKHSDIFKPTYNWMIYGHHMKDGSMFENLMNYEDESFYKSHKTFRFDTIYKETGQAEYEIVAAFKSQIYPKNKKIFKYVNYPGITTDEELEEYVEGIKKLSFYDTGVEVKSGDQLVTLSTCSYHVAGPEKLGRLAIVGRRIDK